MFKNFFSYPKLPRVNSIAEASLANLATAKKTDREIHQQSLNEASVRIEREALQQSLNIQHRTMLIAFFAVVLSITVSIAALVVAIKSKPNVTVQMIAPKSQAR